MALNKLDLLRSKIPEWFSATSDDGADTILGTATIEDDQAIEKLVCDLVIKGGHEITVAEQRRGEKFPFRCSERHIQYDGTFCIGYRVPVYVENLHRAEIWWELLRVFLTLQRIAAKFGMWPPQQAMSHGDAAPYHIRAESAAKELGIEHEYIEMLQGANKWFSTGEYSVMENGGLKGAADLGCPISSCEHAAATITINECCKLHHVRELLDAERSRQIYEKSFWDNREDEECCGTMLRCPLRDRS